MLQSCMLWVGPIMHGKHFLENLLVDRSTLIRKTIVLNIFMKGPYFTYEEYSFKILLFKG